MKKLNLCFFLLCLLSFSAFAQSEKEDKDLEWKTGKVLDTNSSKYTTYGGTTTTGQVNNDGIYSATSNRASWNHEEFVYVIEGEDMAYVVRRVLSFRWEKEASLTVNAPVRYAVKKNTLYFIDENDRKMKAKIVKKVLKEK